MKLHVWILGLAICGLFACTPVENDNNGTTNGGCPEGQVKTAISCVPACSTSQDCVEPALCIGSDNGQICSESMQILINSAKAKWNKATIDNYTYAYKHTVNGQLTEIEVIVADSQAVKEIFVVSGDERTVDPANTMDFWFTLTDSNAANRSQWIGFEADDNDGHITLLEGETYKFELTKFQID